MTEDIEAIKQRSENAKRLLEDPLWKDTLVEVNEALIRAVKSSKTEAEAFKSAIALQVFDLIVGQIKSHAESGKIVEFNQKKRFGLF